MGPNLQETADLVTFTKVILNEKLIFLYSDTSQYESYLTKMLFVDTTVTSESLPGV